MVHRDIWKGSKRFLNFRAPSLVAFRYTGDKDLGPVRVTLNESVNGIGCPLMETPRKTHELSPFRSA